jgi:glycosyltransferase involved in cell wall biosynthesis
MLCEELARQGVDVQVITTNANRQARLNVPLFTQTIVEGVPTIYYPLSLNGLRSFYSYSLQAALDEHIRRSDLVVIQTMWSSGARRASEICRKTGKPYIVIPRGALLPWALRQKSIKKLIYIGLFGKKMLNGAAAIHCTDEFEAHYVRSLHLSSPTIILPNGLDLRYFTGHTRGKLRKRLGIPDDALVLLFAGRLHRKKRPDIALEAFLEIHRHYPNTHLIMAGPDEENLVQTLTSRAKTDRVHFTGLLRADAVMQAYMDSDLLLMPSESLSENFGMSAVEAMASGLAILVSEGVPVGSLAEEAGAGKVVACRIEDFSRAGLELTAQSALLRIMGEKGQILAKERFDIKKIARTALLEYSKLI